MFVRSLLVPAAALFAFAVAAPRARADSGGWFPPQGGDGQPPPAAQPVPQDAVGADDYADDDPSALADFQQPLDGYGQWTQDPTYGTLWVPDVAQVGPDFAPYQTAGQWGVDTNGSWLWQSDYAWGYIPFHYGRWVWAGNYWGWIAGRRYSPAWVSWRVGEGGYVGWAPLPPAWGWRGGRAVGLAVTPYAAFCFVPTELAFNRGVSAYVVRDRGMVASVAASTHPWHPGSGRGGRSGPTLSEAHVPSSAAPHATSRPDVRSTAFASRSSTAAYQSGRSMGEPSIYRGDRGRLQSGGLRTPGGSYHAPSFHAPAYRSSVPQGPHYAAPASHPAYRPPAATAHPTGHTTSHASGGHHR